MVEYTALRRWNHERQLQTRILRVQRLRQAWPYSGGPQRRCPRVRGWRHYLTRWQAYQVPDLRRRRRRLQAEYRVVASPPQQLKQAGTILSVHVWIMMEPMSIVRIRLLFSEKKLPKIYHNSLFLNPQIRLILSHRIFALSLNINTNQLVSIADYALDIHSSSDNNCRS